MLNVLKPPTPLPSSFDVPCIFLAGSIAMGEAELWQARVARELARHPLCLLDPRRDEWDASWPQTAAFAPFREQVEWELAGLERADMIAMYIDPATKSPISLLELGLHARSGRVVVCCPDGFWRKGNVDIVCERYDIPRVDALDELIACIATQAMITPP